MRSTVWLASAVAALLIVAAAVVGLRGTVSQRSAHPPDIAHQSQPAPAPSASATSPAVAPAAVPSSAPQPPSFDIVSIDPHGQAVIAGRAMPGDRVRVLDGDRAIGEVTADARGDWVLVPDTAIAAGNRQLSLEATGREGGPVRRSGDVVALSVAPSTDAQRKGSALAVLLPADPNQPSRVLQRPEAGTQGQLLSLDAAEYSERDRLALTGHGDPGARVNIYAANRLLGTVTADAAGKWSLIAPHRLEAGGIELRLDELAADGAVARRIAVRFEPPGATAADGRNIYVVERGNSLWLIARHVYGKGPRYTTIYAANRDQIRDPDRIYPGQQFKLPRP